MDTASIRLNKGAFSCAETELDIIARFAALSTTVIAKRVGPPCHKFRHLRSRLSATLFMDPKIVYFSPYDPNFICRKMYRKQIPLDLPVTGSITELYQRKLLSNLDAMPVIKHFTAERALQWSIAGLLVGIVAAWASGALDIFLGVDREQIRAWIDTAGILGPLLVVSLMTIAIVASPLPSAPIALAAGAAYGHTLGTILVVFGAELGAVAAFLLARGLGRPFVEKHVGRKLGAGFLGSQNTLTFLVFGSRLLPFLSFDMISYAAGLSKLHFWRFAVATLAGIIPASFLLAHFGSEAMDGDARTAAWTAIALGGFTALSLVFAIWRGRSNTPKES